MIERRRYPRLNISFPVACNMLSRQRYFYTVSRSLGLGGLGILSNKFMSVGSFLKVNINLIDRAISLKAKVIWCNRKRISDRYSVGLEFLELSHRSQHSIDHFLQNIPLTYKQSLV